MKKEGGFNVLVLSTFKNQEGLREKDIPERRKTFSLASADEAENKTQRGKETN
ncbi:MAG: hypothetical protein Q8Q06_00645 [bacterium]|nr:hypothetical protein [bacterium]